MSITVPQIPAAISITQQLQSTLNDMVLLLKQAKDLSDKGWQIDIGSRVSLLVTVSPAQQAALVAQYDAFKTQLSSLFQTLP